MRFCSRFLMSRECSTNRPRRSATTKCAASFAPCAAEMVRESFAEKMSKNLCNDGRRGARKECPCAEKDSGKKKGRRAANLLRERRDRPRGNPMANQYPTNSFPSTAPSLCPHCGSAELYKRTQPPHIALRCADCERWVRWIPRHEGSIFPSKPVAQPGPTLQLVPEPPPKPAPFLKPVTPQQVDSPSVSKPVVCDHSEQLDRLIHHLDNIDRELSIIVRAMMRGGAR